MARLVADVSEDASIEDDAERKAALRVQVAAADDEDALAVFAADKVSRARELRVRLGRGDEHEGDRRRLDHYDASLAMLSGSAVAPQLIERLREELDAVHALRPRGVEA